jgi:hypothetical protein
LGFEDYLAVQWRHFEHQVGAMAKSLSFPTILSFLHQRLHDSITANMLLKSKRVYSPMNKLDHDESDEPPVCWSCVIKLMARVE